MRKKAAQGVPFDHGIFEIVEEAYDAPEAVPQSMQTLVQIRR